MKIFRAKYFRFMSDEKFLKLKFIIRTHYKLDLKNPQTFNEKIQWLKINNRKDIYTTMVDKCEVKKYVENIIGSQYIIPTIGIYDKFDDIEFDSLPNQFVIKCNHDSGGVIICKDKNQLNIKKAKKKINKALKKNYYYESREWPYKNIKRKIIIEKYMQDKEKEELTDYKIMCFNGDPKVIFTCTERYSKGLKVTFFNSKWERMPFTRYYPASTQKIEKPQNLEEMLEISKKLSKDIPFVRVDLYNINGKIYFGEFTFSPGGGFDPFSPKRYDNILGEYIKLPETNK